MSGGITDLSDDTLLQMLGKQPAPAQSAGVAALSDEDLLKALGQPAAAPALQSGDASAAIGRGILNGVPVVGPYLLGGVERGAAGIRSLQSGKPFADELATVRGFSEATARENPASTTGGEIAGGVLGTLPAVAAAPAAFGVGAASLPARIAASTVTGGVIGVGDSAVRSDGDIEKAIDGGRLGGLLGAGAPVFGAAIGAGARAFAGRSSGAEKVLNRALTADALTPELAASRLDELGPAAMIADLGPNLQRQAGALAAAPGEAQQIVRGAIAERGLGASERTVGAADRALGQPVDALSTMEGLIQQRREAAQPLYEAAYSKPMPRDARIEGALKTPAGQKAFAQARVLAENEGEPILANAPTVRALDLTKRSLDDMVEAARRGGNNNEARILAGIRSRLLAGMDAAVPEYGQARAAFASETALQDAFEAGQQLFSRQMTPGQFARTMQGMSEGERDLLQEGARSALADAMGTARNDALKARQLFDAGYNREKLGLLLGPRQAQALIDDLGNEASFIRTRDVVTGNSETAARQAAMKEIAPDSSDKAGIIKSLLNVRAGDAAVEASSKVTRGLGNKLRERRNAELAQILTEVGEDRARAGQAFAALRRSVRSGDITGEVASRLTNAVLRGAGQASLGYMPSVAAR